MGDFRDFEVRYAYGPFRPVPIFHEDDEKVIVVFHDGVEALSGFLDQFDFGKPTLIVVTCASFLRPERAALYRQQIRKAVDGENRAHVSEAAVLMVANSDLEYANFLTSFPPEMVARSNNAVTLSEDVFRIVPAEKTFDSVLNGKTIKLKRHDLAAGLANLAFISYRAGQPGDNLADIENCGAQEIFWSIPPEQVVEVLNRSRVGLALSVQEGACWASLEYLLCGLPVVSTPARGGRDDFYTPTTAVMVKPKREDVRVGVETALANLRSGRFDPLAIRNETLAKVEAIRSGFERDLNAFCARNGCGGIPSGYFGQTARQTSKLLDRWIYWPIEFRLRPAA